MHWDRKALGQELGRGMPDKPEVMPAGEVAMRMTDLMDAVARIENAAMQLVEVMRPVTSELPNETTSPKNVPVPSCCELGAGLATATARLDSATIVMRAAREACQL